jgi:hypothetical protein
MRRPTDSWASAVIRLLDIPRSSLSICRSLRQWRKAMRNNDQESVVDGENKMSEICVLVYLFRVFSRHLALRHWCMVVYLRGWSFDFLRPFGYSCAPSETFLNASSLHIFSLSPLNSRKLAVCM